MVKAACLKGWFRCTLVLVFRVNFVLVSDYGLFCQDDDPSKGKWLEPARTLDFYPLKSGVGLHVYLLDISL